MNNRNDRQLRTSVTLPGEIDKLHDEQHITLTDWIQRYLAHPLGILPLMSLMWLSGCTTTPANYHLHNTAGKSVATQPLDRPGLVSGVGIEAQDIAMMSDQMVKSMLANPLLANRSAPPQIIVDDANFENEGSQRINMKLITNKLRTDLNRAANGRMIFVGRHYAGMVSNERELKRSGAVDVATTGLTASQAGADFRLGGFFNTLDQRSPSTGNIQRYNQLTFEMVDLERSVIVWSDSYEVRRAGREDIVYR